MMIILQHVVPVNKYWPFRVAVASEYHLRATRSPNTCDATGRVFARAYQSCYRMEDDRENECHDAYR